MQITKTQIKHNKILCVLQAEMIKILAKAMMFTHTHYSMWIQTYNIMWYGR